MVGFFNRGPDSVLKLSDSLLEDRLGQPHAVAARRGLPGRPTGGPENSFTEKQIFYDVGGSIFVAGWAEGFLGGRAEPSRVKGDVRVDTVGELVGFFTTGSISY